MYFALLLLLSTIFMSLYGSLAANDDCEKAAISARVYRPTSKKTTKKAYLLDSTTYN